ATWASGRMTCRAWEMRSTRTGDKSIVLPLKATERLPGICSTVRGQAGMPTLRTGDSAELKRSPAPRQVERARTATPRRHRCAVAHLPPLSEHADSAGDGQFIDAGDHHSQHDGRSIAD